MRGVARRAGHVIDVVQLKVDFAAATRARDVYGSILLDGTCHDRTILALDRLGLEHVVFFGFVLGRTFC